MCAIAKGNSINLEKFFSSFFFDPFVYALMEILYCGEMENFNEYFITKNNYTFA